MQNDGYERLGKFLCEIRNGNIPRETEINVPGYEELEKELAEWREQCDELVKHLPSGKQQMIVTWMEGHEKINSMEVRKSYCKGYVDCLLLLSGLGLLEQDLPLDELKKWLK